MESILWIPDSWADHWIPNPWIWDSTSKNFPDSGLCKRQIANTKEMDAAALRDIKCGKSIFFSDIP